MFFDISKSKKYSLSSREARYTDANQASYNYQTSQKKVKEKYVGSYISIFIH